MERLITHIGGTGVFRVAHGAEVPLAGAPDLALRAERSANATAARALGFVEASDVLATLREGDALLVAGDALEHVDEAALTKASSVVFVGTVLPPMLEHRVTVVLPSTNIVEEEGTLTNLRGRVQRFLQAKAAPGVARPTWYVLADLLNAVGGQGSFYLPAEVFAALSSTHAAFAGLDYESLGLRGLPLASATLAAAPAQSAEVAS